MIQIPHRCEYYKKNENMNLTCTFKGIEKMCRIYYGEQCKEYNDEKFNFDSDFNSSSDRVESDKSNEQEAKQID